MGAIATMNPKLFPHWKLGVKKKVDRHFKKGFNIVIDEVEPFDFFIEKK